MSFTKFCTSVDTVGNSVRSRSRVFLQSKEVIKLSLINSPIDVIRSLFNKSQNLFMLVMSRAFFFACLENGSPIFAMSSSRVIFSIQGVALFICNSTEGQHRFLVAPGTLALSTSSQSNVFSVCVQGRVETSASRASRFSRVRPAKIWLSRKKSIHSKENVSEQSSIGFQASQHRMSVPICRFR